MKTRRTLAAVIALSWVAGAIACSLNPHPIPPEEALGPGSDAGASYDSSFGETPPDEDDVKTHDAAADTDSGDAQSRDAGDATDAADAGDADAGD